MHERHQHSTVPAAGLPELPLEEFDREYAIERFPQRKAMLNLGVGFWIATLFWTLTAGTLTPPPDTELQSVLRIVLPIVSIAAIVLLMFARSLDDQRTGQLIVALSILSVSVQFTLSTFGPGSLGAMYPGLMATAIFAAQFAGPRMLALILTLASAAVLLAAYVNYDNPDTHHVLSNSVLNVMVYWAIGYAGFAIARDRQAALAGAERVAFGDPLTGIPNTRALRRQADALLDQRNRRINSRVGVVVMDLDGFRATNVLHGHRDGDRLLKSVSTSLTAEADDDHVVARTGSDEFTVLIADTNPSELKQTADRYRHVVHEAIAQLSTQGGGLGTGVDVSVGSAMSGAEGRDFDALMRVADSSLYGEKAVHARGAHQVDSPAVISGDSARGWVPSSEPHGTELPVKPWWHWSMRPVNTRFIAFGWFCSVLGVALSMAMPDAVVTNAFVVEILIVFGSIMAALYYFKRESSEVLDDLRDAVIAAVTVAAVVSVTGFSESAAYPIPYIILIYICWFTELRYIPAFIALTVMIVLSPLLFEESGGFALMDTVSLVVGVFIAAIIAFVLYSNHMHLDRARALTEQLSTLDPRTGVHNRRAFEERMSYELERLSYGDREALAVVILDLGNFKSVSANLGRGVADRLLTEVAGALTVASRGEDSVARLGGDEFAVIAPGVDAESAQALAQRLIDAVRETVGGLALPDGERVRPSAGFSLYGMHGRTADELLTAADIALTAAKTAGRDPSRVSSFVVGL